MHGVLKKIFLESDEKFTTTFWKDLFASLGIELSFNKTYHPQTDGETESVSKILEDMLRMYVMHQQWKWEYSFLW